MSVKIERPEWGNFAKALAIKDKELTAAEEQSSFEPPAGQYECAVVGRSGTIFTDEATGESNFSISMKYQITEGEYAGETFFSQSYNFNEQGIGWTKAFVKTLAGLDEAPNTAQELTDAIDLAVEEQHGVHLDVKFRTYTKKNGDKKTVIQDKILQWVGSLLNPDTDDKTNGGSEADGA